MSASLIIDGYLAPTLVPTIMGINLYKQSKIDKLDIFYCTISFGCILSSICSLLQYRIQRSTRSRIKLTILTAILLTISSLITIIGFSAIRINIPSPSNSYKLPISIRNQINSSGSDVFRYHFFADFIPGFIILLQTQLCTIAQHELLFKAKRTFTIGEASIIAQLASVSFLSWALITYTKITQAGPFKVGLTTEIILNIGFIVFSVAVLPFYLFTQPKTRTIRRYFLLAASVALSYLRVQQLISVNFDTEPIKWLVNYIFSSHQRISLFSLWLSTLTACISFSTTWSRMVGSTNSLVRKIFHLAIGIVFISGYNQDIEFTRFASGGIFILLVFIETIRASQLRPMGHHLENICRSLRGKWDNKYLTLSHIYLLMGVFLPLWILPNSQKITTKVLLSSGMISVGIGDTAAAICGILLGRTKLKGRAEKTLEGLAGNIICMMIFKALWIDYTGFVDEFSFATAAILTALVEAVSTNCDNLILPLVMILFLEIF